MTRSRGSGRVRYRLHTSTYGNNSYSTIITIGPSLTGLRGTRLTGSINYTLVTGPISIILLSPVYFTHTVYFLALFTLLAFSTIFHSIRSYLCFKQTGEIDNLIASWEQSTWLCVCRFHVAASKQSLDKAPYINCPLLSQTSKHHLHLSLSAFLLNDKPWFLTEGKRATILITPSSWGSQRAGHSPRITPPAYRSSIHHKYVPGLRLRVTGSVSMVAST
jgi:hypothetical protein